MKCSEFHELAAAYVLDTLDEDERQACEHHLTHEGPHEDCTAILARYERTTGALSELVAPLPVSPNVYRAIEARLGFDQPAGAKVVRLPTRSRSLAWMGWAAAACALLAALFAYQQQRAAELARVVDRDTLAHTHAELSSVQNARAACQEALQQLEQRGASAREAVALLDDPATRVLPMGPAGAAPLRATALFNPKQKRALIVSNTLTAQPGKDYELWVIHADAAPKPAGFVRFEAGVAVGEFDPRLLSEADPQAFAVSLEPAGGRPTPTEVVLLAKVPG